MHDPSNEMQLIHRTRSGQRQNPFHRGMKVWKHIAQKFIDKYQVRIYFLTFLCQGLVSWSMVQYALPWKRGGTKHQSFATLQRSSFLVRSRMSTSIGINGHSFIVECGSQTDDCDDVLGVHIFSATIRYKQLSPIFLKSWYRRSGSIIY